MFFSDSFQMSDEIKLASFEIDDLRDIYTLKIVNGRLLVKNLKGSVNFTDFC